MIPHIKLHKRHTALSLHRVREAIAGDLIQFYHMNGKDNPADILSKHWAHSITYPNLQPILFWEGDTIDCTATLKQVRDHDPDHDNSKQKTFRIDKNTTVRGVTNIDLS